MEWSELFVMAVCVCCAPGHGHDEPLFEMDI